MFISLCPNPNKEQQRFTHRLYTFAIIRVTRLTNYIYYSDKRSPIFTPVYLLYIWSWNNHIVDSICGLFHFIYGDSSVLSVLINKIMRLYNIHTHTTNKDNDATYAFIYNDGKSSTGDLFKIRVGKRFWSPYGRTKTVPCNSSERSDWHEISESTQRTAKDLKRASCTINPTYFFCFSDVSYECGGWRMWGVWALKGALRRLPRYMARPPTLARCARSGRLAGGFAPARRPMFLLNYLCDDNAIINISAYVFYSNWLFHFCDVSFDCELKVCGVFY